MRLKKIATETQRHGEKHFREKGPFFISLCASVAKKLKSNRTGRGFLKADLNDEPDGHEYLKKNC